MASDKSKEIRELGKNLSKVITDHVDELNNEFGKPDTPADRKKVIDLKLRALGRLKSQLDDIESCTFDTGLLDFFGH